MKNPNLNVLFLAAHPDDIEGLMAGTAIRHSRSGARCFEAVMTRGERGAVIPSGRNASLAGVREREARYGAQILGIEEALFFDFLDGKLRNTPRLRDVINQIIKSKKPSIVYAPEFDKSAYPHRDHIELGAATFEVWEKLDKKPTLRFFHPLNPTDIYPTDEFAAQRKRSFKSHRSQKWINSLIGVGAVITMPLRLAGWIRETKTRHFEFYREVKP